MAPSPLEGNPEACTSCPASKTRLLWAFGCTATPAAGLSSPWVLPGIVPLQAASFLFEVSHSHFTYSETVSGHLHVMVLTSRTLRLLIFKMVLVKSTVILYGNLAELQHPGVWPNNILDVSVRVFSDEINIYIGRLRESRLPSVKWVGCIQSVEGTDRLKD